MAGTVPAVQEEPLVLAVEMAALPARQVPSVSVWPAVWLSGMILCAAFFAVSYLRCSFEFQTSLPVHNEFANQWLKENRLIRPISVRQSDRIPAPLTYGIFKPVILMPKNTDWENKTQLQFIFLHEYIHICRYDAVTKLVSAFALCIHWFNPLVWVMYVLFNRDMELACDESVIQKLGESSKSIYAHMLIRMEAEQSGLLPFCNGFSKNAIEERITAIMKVKKTSFFAIFTAVILIAGVTAAFATSAAENGEEKISVPDTDFSDEEFDKLSALQFDGYEDMSISEFQNKVWKLTDTREYRSLLERFSKDTALYEQKDRNAASSFLFYILEPLTAEKWQTRDFGGYAATDYPGVSDNAMLEYIFSLTIQNADTLTVGEYNAARLDVANGLQSLLQGKTEEQLRDSTFMLEAIDAEIEKLNGHWTGKLQISVDYSYMPLSEPDTGKGNPEGIRQEQEIRGYPNGTEEDYRSLLALKTADYQDRPVADFNMDLLEWANESYERMERINCDIGYHDFSVDLSNDELSFVTSTVCFSGTETAKYVQSNYTGRPEEEPSYACYLPEKADAGAPYGGSAWRDLYYQFSWRITDKETLTVGERDRLLIHTINGIQDFWNETDIEQLLSMTKEDIVKELKEIAAEYSNGSFAITIREDSVSFEKMDERNIY